MQNLAPLKSKKEVPIPGQIWSLKKESSLVLPELKLSSPAGLKRSGKPLTCREKNSDLSAWIRRRKGDYDTLMQGLSYKVEHERLVLVIGCGPLYRGAFGRFWMETSTFFVVPVTTSLEHAEINDVILDEKDSSTGLRLAAECWNTIPILGSAFDKFEGTVRRNVALDVRRLSHYCMGALRDPGRAYVGPIVSLATDLEEWRNAEADHFLKVANPRRILIELSMEGWFRSYCETIAAYEALSYAPPRRVLERAISFIKTRENARSIRAYRAWWRAERKRCRKSVK